MLFNDGLIETNGFFIFVILHEEHMSNIKFPSIMLIAELQ